MTKMEQKQRIGWIELYAGLAIFIIILTAMAVIFNYANSIIPQHLHTGINLFRQMFTGA